MTDKTNRFERFKKLNAPVEPRGMGIDPPIYPVCHAGYDSWEHMEKENPHMIDLIRLGKQKSDERNKI